LRAFFYTLQLMPDGICRYIVNREMIMQTNIAETDKKTADVGLILKDLLKVIKVVSMYPENNPLPQSMKRSFAEKLESLIEEYGDIAISVSKDKLRFEKQVVYTDRSKEENLAGIFYEAGVTNFIFKIGFDINEIYQFLEIFKIYLNDPNKSQDLVGMLWEGGISRIGFQTLEDIALTKYDENFNIQEFIDQSDLSDEKDYGRELFGTDDIETYQAIFVNSDDSRKIKLSPEEIKEIRNNQHLLSNRVPSKNQSIFFAVLPDEYTGTALDEDELDETSLKTFQAAEAMGFSDLAPSSSGQPSTTLILNDELKLSEEEEEEIRSIIKEDALFDPFESTQELLKEMILLETELESFFETVTICEKIINEFVKKAKLKEASSIIFFIKGLQEQLSAKKPLWGERVKEFVTTIGSRDRLKILAESLNNYPEISGPELKKYLSNFGWEALSGITDLIGDINNEQHRECLVSYLSEQGKNNIHIVGKGIYDKRKDVAYNSISILAQIGDEKALNYLSRGLEHKDIDVRRKLVSSLKDCTNEKCLEILAKAFSDECAEVRREVANALVNRRGAAAFEVISNIITDDNFFELDTDEQQSLMIAYSVLGGDNAVSYLVRIINTYNYSRNAGLSFLRFAAFEALSRNRSDKCERELIKLSHSWRPDIKRQANQALHKRREFIYGGNE